MGREGKCRSCPPKWKDEQIVCGSNMMTGYISSYLFISDSEIIQDRLVQGIKL